MRSSINAVGSDVGLTVASASAFSRMLAIRPLRLLAVVLSIILALGAVARADTTATVVIDGRHVSLYPRAILREGSVFVPVRGVFENLGASVVFSNGRIVAHGKHGETIVMYVGQRSASVNGQHVMLDNAPFIVGATTFVPLRFVSEALGAQVSFDNRSKTVYIQSKTRPEGPATQPPQASPATPSSVPQSQTFRLLDEQPRPGSNVRSANPAISANFSSNVDPNSVTVTVDGRDVTAQAFVGNNRFSVTPSFDLPNGNRTVQVGGKTATGEQFSQNWSFDVRSDISVTRNFVQVRSPGEGSSVTSPFQLSGRTLPLSLVNVAATATTSSGGDSGIVGPSFSRQIRADPLGNFSLDVTVPNALSFVRVFIQSASPDGASAEKTVTFSTRPQGQYQPASGAPPQTQSSPQSQTPLPAPPAAPSPAPPAESSPVPVPS